MRIDLHTHSSVSDGTESPAALVAAARAAGLDVVALTDHDTTGGWGRRGGRPPGRAHGRPRHGDVLPLVPRPTDRPVSVHLLAYLFDPRTAGLAAERARLRDERLGRAERIVDGAGRRRPPGELGGDRRRPRRRRGGPPAHRPGAGRRGRRRFGRPRLRHAAAPRPARTTSPRPTPTSCEGIALVRAAGGVPVFAHGLATKRGPRGRRRRDRRDGRGRAARPRGRPSRPPPRRARPPARAGRRPRSAHDRVE